jgi:NTE family protein
MGCGHGPRLCEDAAVGALSFLGLPDLRRLFSKASAAATFGEFRSAAADLEARTGADAWRADDESRIYDSALLREHTEGLRRLRERRDAAALAPYLQEVLYRHQGELSDPALYEVSLLGTKHLVERFWEESEAAIDWLSRPEESGLTRAQTIGRVERAARVYGRSALLLSGGSTLGFFHVGVVKALFEQGLLPRVLSGASIGAMVACGIGARTDAELRALFADVHALRTDALLRVSPLQMARQRAAFDPERLREVILHNNGDSTFGEAHARSGRIVNVSVSPTRQRQKPRLLCYLNAPDVTLTSATLASAAVPWVFPPAVLEQRRRGGPLEPYSGTETWIDGSFKGDVPTQRLARLHNVNHFIVSQVNPHVAPVRRVVRRRGLLPFLLDAALSSVRVQVAHDLGMVRRALEPTPLFATADLAHALVDQSYGGDIDIHPPLQPGALARAFSNLTADQLDRHVLEGQRATWPLLPRLRDQTRVERALDRALRRLYGAAAGAAAESPP